MDSVCIISSNCNHVWAISVRLGSGFLIVRGADPDSTISGDETYESLVNSLGEAAYKIFRPTNG